jgi:hypothetical protein
MLGSRTGENQLCPAKQTLMVTVANVRFPTISTPGQALSDTSKHPPQNPCFKTPKIAPPNEESLVGVLTARAVLCLAEQEKKQG